MGEPLRRDERSQPLLRVPRDKTPGELVLDDGERAYVQFFIPLGNTLAGIYEDRYGFLPVAIDGNVRMVARSAIACMTAHVMHAGGADPDVALERQRVIARLRGGTVIRGELRWVAPPGYRRTLDHLNDAAVHIVIHDGDFVHFIAKSAVLSVEEN
jgi:hypothetical protein